MSVRKGRVSQKDRRSSGMDARETLYAVFGRLTDTRETDGGQASLISESHGSSVIFLSWACISEGISEDCASKGTKASVSRESGTPSCRGRSQLVNRGRFLVIFGGLSCSRELNCRFVFFFRPSCGGQCLASVARATDTGDCERWNAALALISGSCWKRMSDGVSSTVRRRSKGLISEGVQI